MIITLALAAFAQDIEWTPPSAVDSLGLGTVRVAQFEETWLVTFGSGGGGVPRVSVPEFVLHRAADHVTAGLFGRFVAGATFPAMVLDVFEPDPATPGARRLAQRITLTDPVVSGWGVTYQTDVTPVETTTLVASDYAWCRYAYPGPTVTCTTWDVLGGHP